mgnify:CR=1 FL=1
MKKVQMTLKDFKKFNRPVGGVFRGGWGITLLNLLGRKTPLNPKQINIINNPFSLF